MNQTWQKHKKELTNWTKEDPRPTQLHLAWIVSVTLTITSIHPQKTNNLTNNNSHNRTDSKWRVTILRKSIASSSWTYSTSTSLVKSMLVSSSIRLSTLNYCITTSISRVNSRSAKPSLIKDVHYVKSRNNKCLLVSCN